MLSIIFGSFKFLFTHCYVTFSKPWKKAFLTSAKSISDFSIWQALIFLFFLNGPKIDTAVLFDNNAHLYFLVHRKPYYTKTLVINSLTFAEWDMQMKGYLLLICHLLHRKAKRGSTPHFCVVP